MPIKKSFAIVMLSTAESKLIDYFGIMYLIFIGASQPVLILYRGE